MKKLLIVVFLIWSYSMAALPSFNTTDSVYTQNREEALSTDDIQWDPLRQWATSIWSQTEWIINQQPITDFGSAMDQTLLLVQNALNYLLWFLATIALIYLIYHGVPILLSPTDASKVDEAKKAVTRAIYALGGIAFSWLFVSIVFWVLEQVL